MRNVVRNPYCPLSKGEGKSETSFWINLLALAITFILVCVCWKSGMTSPGEFFFVMLVLLLFLTVFLETFFYPRNCALRRLKVRRSLSWRRVFFREVALVATFLVIGFAYWLFPLFADKPIVTYYRPFLCCLVPALLLLSVPYFCFMDRRDPEEEDAMCRLGRAIVTRRRTLTSFEFWNYVRIWAVKAFWLVLMQPSMAEKFVILVSYPAEKLAGNPMQMYLVAATFCFSLDLAYASSGYVLNLKAFNTHTRTAEPTLLGWIAALSCYWPFWAALFYPYFFKYESPARWEAFFPPGSAVWWALAGTTVLLEFLYASATIAAGIRFSNLTYRGLWNTGPYRWTKHPAYVFKGLSWWLIALPFMLNSGMNAVKCTLLLIGVDAIYYLRAKTEERHLSHYPEYVAYALSMNEKSIFRWCARILPFLKYRPPGEGERIFEVEREA